MRSSRNRDPRRPWPPRSRGRRTRAPPAPWRRRDPRRTARATVGGTPARSARPACRAPAWQGHDRAPGPAPAAARMCLLISRPGQSGQGRRRRVALRTVGGRIIGSGELRLAPLPTALATWAAEISSLVSAERIRDDVEAIAEPSVTYERLEGANVVARKRGTSGRRAILVGAHFDTVSASPGADDNASGVAALLELARVLGSARFEHDLLLVAFDMEE